MTPFMPRYRAGDIATSLRRRIDSGEWSSDGALPNERALAAEYGVARNTLRSALAELEREGLLSRHIGKGTLIKSQAQRQLIGIMTRIAGTSPLDIMNIRLIIEPEATAAAATNARSSDLTAIRQAHENACGEREFAAFGHWDMEFHKRIFASTRNDFLTNLHDILMIIRSREPMVAIRQRSFSEPRRLAYCDQHARIVEALNSRDAKVAAQAMAAHLAARRSDAFGIDAKS